MKKLILHIGTPKTGTTTIQQTLGNSREKLLKYNIYYPRIFPYNHSCNFPVILMEDPNKFDFFRRQGINNYEEIKEEQNKLKNMWIKEFRDCNSKNFIISAEGLSSIDKQSVNNLKNLYEQFFDDILIIIYVRHPNDFYPSFINEYIKHGGQKLLHDNYYEKFPLYRNRLENYITVFGEDKIKVRPFNENTFKNKSLLEDFFFSSELNIDIKELKQIKMNESLSENAVLFLTEYNKYFPFYKNGVVNGERGLTKDLQLFLNILSRIKGKKFMFEVNYSKEDVILINKEIEFINRYLTPDNKFKEVSYNRKHNQLLSLNNIPIRFYTELINEYNKEIDNLLEKMYRFISENKSNKKDIKMLKNEIKLLEINTNKNSEKKVVGLELLNKDTDLILSEVYSYHSKSKIRKFKNLCIYYIYRGKGLLYFDNEFYKNNNADVVKNGMDPLKHFLLYGVYEGRNPSKKLNIHEYIKNNPEIILSGENPLVHIKKK